ncbi:MAG: glycosyltransferase family 2 protein [Acidimicrobiia bacterium]
MSEERPLVSFVVPLFDEAENVPALIEHLEKAADANPGYAFELIAVDDGSRDQTFSALSNAVHTGLPITTVRLTRNFGSHHAISAGFAHARGDAAIVLGADLQEPMDLVGSFIAEWEKGADVVWGIRRSRVVEKGLGPKASSTFSKLLNRYSEIPSYPSEGPSGVCVTRPVLDILATLKERNRNVLGLIAWVGFRQARVEYDQLPRRAGTSKWTRANLLKLAFDSFVQFSHTPIRFAGLLGLIISGIGFVYAVFISIRAIVGAGAPEGWTTVIVTVLVLGGLQLIVLSVFGEYLWRTTDEARGRPLYLVRDVTRTDADE